MSAAATAGVGADLILDTGNMVVEHGYAGLVYLANYIPAHQIPEGPSVALWIEGFSTIFSTIAKIFDSGEIPTAIVLERALAQLPRDKQPGVKAYESEGATLYTLLVALIYQAKEEWESGEFEDTYGPLDCDKTLSVVCAEHDLNWIMAAYMLVESE